MRLDTVYSLYDNKLAQKEDVSYKVSFKDGKSIDFPPTDSFGDDEAQKYRHTLKTIRHRISRIRTHGLAKTAMHRGAPRRGRLF